MPYLRKLDPDARAFGLGYLVLLPLFLAPLFVTRFLPGLDLPFHLAMADMLGKVGTPTDPYRELYQGKLGLEPYAVHYIALRLLGRFGSLMTAHKLVVGHLRGHLAAGAWPPCWGRPGAAACRRCWPCRWPTT